jgi:hypothetical protein
MPPAACRPLSIALLALALTTAAEARCRRPVVTAEAAPAFSRSPLPARPRVPAEPQFGGDWPEADEDDDDVPRPRPRGATPAAIAPVAGLPAPPAASSGRPAVAPPATPAPPAGGKPATPPAARPAVSPPKPAAAPAPTTVATAAPIPPAAKKPPPPPPLLAWSILPGQTLRQTLAAWTAKAGWSLAWSDSLANIDYVIEAGHTWRGGFLDAAKELMRNYRNVDVPLKIEVVMGNRQFRVLADSDAYSRTFDDRPH